MVLRHCDTSVDDGMLGLDRTRGGMFLSGLSCLATSRPSADVNIEQFLMTERSLIAQHHALRTLIDGRRLVILGDDDHLSVMLSHSTRARITVIELDGRVCASLRSWCTRLTLSNLTIICADIRSIETVMSGPQFDVFYVNPPYSSKNGGHGLRAWVSAALAVCVADCLGIVVMPAEEMAASWVHRNSESMRSFLHDNGFVILEIPPLRCEYNDTRDKNLKSCNWIVRRVDPSRRRIEIPRVGAGLYRQ
jgi:predicted methyltransferase